MSETLAWRRIAEAADNVVREYRSHGGPGTHQRCFPGCGCMLPKDIDALESALAAIPEPSR